MTSHLRAFTHAATITAAALSTLALGASTNAATAAAVDSCTATIAVTDSTGASLGSLATGDYSPDWLTPSTTRDPRQFTISDPNGDGLITIVGSNGLYYFTFPASFSNATDPSYISVFTGVEEDQEYTGSFSVGQNGLMTLTEFDVEGNPVVLPTGVAELDGDYAFSGGVANIATARQTYPELELQLATWNLVPVAGSDCSPFITPTEPTTPTAEPTITVDGGPENGVTVTEAPTYTFYANTNAGVTGKECRIDTGDWAACDSPYTVPIDGLSDGTHTVDFRAVTPTGYSTVVSRTFILDAVMDPAPDTTAPVVAFASGTVDGTSYDTAPTFTFGSADTDVAGYECSIDGAEFRTCTSPITPDTAPGAHTLAVRATDTTGNTSTPVSTTWTLRDVACDDARADLREARADRRDVKTRLVTAIASGKEYRIKKVRAQLREARTDVRSAKTDVAENC